MTDTDAAREALIAYAATTRTVTADGLAPFLDALEAAARAEPAAVPRVDRAAVLREAAEALEARRCSPESVDVVLRLFDERLCDTCKGYGQTATPTEDGGIVRRCKPCEGKGLRRMAAEAPTATKPDRCPHGCDTSTCPCLACEDDEPELPREPHPTEADLRHAQAVLARFQGRDTDEPAAEAQQDGARS